MSKVYVFTEDTLNEAISAWETRQIAEKPEHEERIRIAVAAMGWFFDSEEVIAHKMIMQQDEKPTK